MTALLLSKQYESRYGNWNRYLMVKYFQGGSLINEGNQQITNRSEGDKVPLISTEMIHCLPAGAPCLMPGPHQTPDARRAHLELVQGVKNL